MPDSLLPRHEPIIRPFQPSDADSVRQLLTAAFGRPSVATLAEELRCSDAHRAALVAQAPNEADATAQAPNEAAQAAGEAAAIGCVQLSRGWLDAAPELVEVLVLSPLGVLPTLHGRGVGAALVRAAIATAAELGPPLLFLEGSPRYYPRFGFQPAGAHGFLRPSVRIPEPAFQVIKLPSWQPWMVGALVYPEVFWRHDAVGRREERSNKDR
jgi:putative acetyltransferase